MDVTGLAELMKVIFEGIANLDLKTINFDSLAALLDLVAPIWNPIWQVVEDFLKDIFYATGA